MRAHAAVVYASSYQTGRGVGVDRAQEHAYDSFGMFRVTQPGPHDHAPHDAPAGAVVAPDLKGVRPSLVQLTHVIYGLHAFSVLTGIFGAASVIGAFLVGWPSIIAVILNYVKRSDVAGTWLESHFRWQIRTFWFAFLWVLIAIALGLTIIGLPLMAVILVVVTLWLIYRVARGWLALSGVKPMPL